jgi:hypothetical protein
MPVKEQEIETVVISLKARSDEKLSEQISIIHARLARSNLKDITCVRYFKEKRYFRCCARITASGPLPEIMHLIRDISVITLDC